LFCFTKQTTVTTTKIQTGVKLRSFYFLLKKRRKKERQTERKKERKKEREKERKKERKRRNKETNAPFIVKEKALGNTNHSDNWVELKVIC
jgi:plasmid replication initiation protein